MKYCTITPNRGGERNELFQFCLKQLQKMNGGHHVTNAYIMNDRPISDQCDLIPRVKYAVDLAIRDGYEYAFIVESDDYYPADYFNFEMNADFIGFEKTVYYNIRNRSHQNITHSGRSSLFCTGFRLEALKGFNWPADHVPFLDLALWKFAKEKKKKVKLIKQPTALGIKHGIDKCGGKAHKWDMRNKDHDLSYLKSHTDEESFLFYTDLMKRL